MISSAVDRARRRCASPSRTGRPPGTCTRPRRRDPRARRPPRSRRDRCGSGNRCCPRAAGARRARGRARAQRVRRGPARRRAAIASTTSATDRQLLVLDLDRLHGRGGLGLALGGHRRDRLAVEAHLVDGDHRAVADRVSPVLVDVGQIPAGQHARRRRASPPPRRVSIETMRACGTGERSTFPCSIRGSTMSPANSAWPRSFSAASRRGAERPIWRTAVRSTVLIRRPPRSRGRPRGCPGSRCSGRGCPRARAGSARLVAELAARPAATAIVSSIPGVQNPHCTAAWRVNASSSGTKRSCSRRPSIVRTSRPCGVGGEEAARADRLAVDEHRARAAHLHLARGLRALQVEAIAQEVEQQLLRLDLPHDGRPLTVSSRLMRRAGRCRVEALEAPGPGGPVLLDEAILVLVGDHVARAGRARSGAASRACRAMLCRRIARSSVSAVSTAQGTLLPTTSTPWLRRTSARRSPSASATACPRPHLRDQVRRLLEDRDPRRRAPSRASASRASHPSRRTPSRRAGARARPRPRRAAPV